MRFSRSGGGVGAVCLGVGLALWGFHGLTQSRGDWDFAGDGYYRFLMLRELVRTGNPSPAEIAGRLDYFAAGGLLATAPAYLAGELANRWRGGGADEDYAAFLVLQVPRLATAATGALLAWTAAALGAGPRGGAFAGLAFGLCTMAWAYTNEVQTEPLVAFWLLGTLACQLGALGAGSGSGRRFWLLASGASLGFAILTRPEIAATGPAFAVHWALATRGEDGGWARARRLCGELGLWGAAAAWGVAGSLGWNQFRYGSPFETGYGRFGGEENPPARFSTPLAAGVFGLLFSPGKGLLWFNPVLWLLPGAWRRFRRGNGAAAWCAVLVWGASLSVYGKFWCWGGDAAWGPRFLVSAMPFAVLPLGWLRRPRGWGGRARVWGALGLSFAVQASGALVPLRGDYAYKGEEGWGRLEREMRALEDWTPDDDTMVLHYVPSRSPLVARWGRLREEGPRLVWFPKGEDGRRSASPAAGIWAGALALGALRIREGLRG